jgi:hypothetical protein
MRSFAWGRGTIAFVDQVFPGVLPSKGAAHLADSVISWP